MPVPGQSSPGPTQQPYANGGGSAHAQTNVSQPQPQSPPPPFLNPHLQQTGYPFVRPPSGSASPGSPPLQGASTPDETPLTQLSPVERSQNLNLRKRITKPYLQFMCGPLLRYDTIDELGVWHGAALIVSKCWLKLFPSRTITLGNVIRSCGRWVDV